MSGISFFTPISFKEIPNPSIFKICLEKVDDYFYFGGKKAFLCIQGDSLKMKKPSPISIEEKRIKLITFCTILIPAAILIAKIVLRSIFFLTNSSIYLEKNRLKSKNEKNELNSHLSSNHQEKQQTEVKPVTSLPNPQNETKSDYSDSERRPYLFNRSPYGFSFDEFLKNKPMSEEVTNEMISTPSSQSQKIEDPAQVRNYEKVNIPPMKKCGMELSDKIIASLKRVVKKLEEGTEDELSFKFNYESSEYTIFQLPGAREYVFKIPAGHSDGEWKAIEDRYETIVEIKEASNQLSLDLLTIPNCQLLYIQNCDRPMPILVQEKINPANKPAFDHNSKEKALTQLLELISIIPIRFLNPEDLMFLNSQNGDVKIAIQSEAKARTTKLSIEGGGILNNGLLSCLNSEDKEYVLKEGGKRNLLQ